MVNRRIVLLVEDEESIRTIMEELLTNEGFEVFQASTVDGAIMLIDTEPVIDIILLDIVLGGRISGGLEVAKRVQELKLQGREIPILVVSGSSAEDARKTAVALAHALPGNSVWIQKPIDTDFLLKMIRMRLGS